jgi:antitoxin HigA-1
MTFTIASDEKDLSLVHPGEVLLEEFMRPHGLTAYAVAAALHVPRNRIERLARGQTPVTVDTARRLARLFRTTPAFWLNLQTAYDLAIVDGDDELAAIEPVAATG